MRIEKTKKKTKNKQSSEYTATKFMKQYNQVIHNIED